MKHQNHSQYQKDNKLQPVAIIIVQGINIIQGGHIPAEIKFPVFSLSFPCVTTFFPVFFSIKLIDGFEY